VLEKGFCRNIKTKGIELEFVGRFSRWIGLFKHSAEWQRIVIKSNNILMMQFEDVERQSRIEGASKNPYP